MDVAAAMYAQPWEQNTVLTGILCIPHTAQTCSNQGAQHCAVTAPTYT
jgi:hypothetical protein